MTEDKQRESEPLPVTGELGDEGGSYGDGASRESRENPSEGPDRVRDTTVTDILGNVTPLPDAGSDAAAPAVRDELRKHPTE